MIGTRTRYSLAQFLELQELPADYSKLQQPAPVWRLQVLLRCSSSTEPPISY